MWFHCWKIHRRHHNADGGDNKIGNYKWSEDIGGSSFQKQVDGALSKRHPSQQRPGYIPGPEDRLVPSEKCHETFSECTNTENKNSRSPPYQVRSPSFLAVPIENQYRKNKRKNSSENRNIMNQLRQPSSPFYRSINQDQWIYMFGQGIKQYKNKIGLYGGTTQ